MEDEYQAGKSPRLWIMEKRENKPSFMNGGQEMHVTRESDGKNIVIPVMEVVKEMITGDCTTKLVVYNARDNRYCGVLKRDLCCILIDWTSSERLTVHTDCFSHEMIVYDGDAIAFLSQNTGCIDMNTSGKRWEGYVKDGKPFGYGILYDEEGNKEYEGFMMDGLKTCYGKEYYSDIDTLKYDGCYHRGKRFGRGILYDRAGSIEYEGDWAEDAVYCENAFISCLCESLVIPDDSFNDANDIVLHSLFSTLSEIVIGSDCFDNTRVFEVNGLSQLKSITVGTRTGKVGDYVRNDGLLCIVNCPKLKSIVIGEDSFCDYHDLELANLPSLESLSMEGMNFYWAPVFSLTSWNVRLTQYRPSKAAVDDYW